jgi:hypothetical protein
LFLVSLFFKFPSFSLSFPFLSGNTRDFGSLAFNEKLLHRELSGLENRIASSANYSVALYASFEWLVRRRK